MKHAIKILSLLLVVSLVSCAGKKDTEKTVAEESKPALKGPGKFAWIYFERDDKGAPLWVGDDGSISQSEEISAIGDANLQALFADPIPQGSSIFLDIESDNESGYLDTSLSVVDGPALGMKTAAPQLLWTAVEFDCPWGNPRARIYVREYVRIAPKYELLQPADFADTWIGMTTKCRVVRYFGETESQSGVPESYSITASPNDSNLQGHKTSWIGRKTELGEEITPPMSISRSNEISLRVEGNLDPGDGTGDTAIRLYSAYGPVREGIYRIEADCGLGWESMGELDEEGQSTVNYPSVLQAAIATELLNYKIRNCNVRVGVWFGADMEANRAGKKGTEKTAAEESDRDGSGKFLWAHFERDKKGKPLWDDGNGLNLHSDEIAATGDANLQALFAESVPQGSRIQINSSNEGYSGAPRTSLTPADAFKLNEKSAAAQLLWTAVEFDCPWGNPRAKIYARNDLRIAPRHQLLQAADFADTWLEMATKCKVIRYFGESESQSGVPEPYSISSSATGSGMTGQKTSIIGKKKLSEELAQAMFGDSNNEISVAVLGSTRAAGTNGKVHGVTKITLNPYLRPESVKSGIYRIEADCGLGWESMGELDEKGQSKVEYPSVLQAAAATELLNYKIRNCNVRVGVWVEQIGKTEATDGGL